MSRDSSEVAALSKTAIVRQALRITAHLGEAQLSLERAASYAGVDPATAQAIFQDTPGLIRELNDHLNSRLRALCTEEDARLPEGACAVERLRANMNSYFRFGQEEPAGFAAFIALRWDGEPAIQFEESPNQAEWQWSYAEMLRRTRAVLVEYGAPRSVDLLNRYSLTALAVVHGASHMCVFGAARHLAPAGRRHTMTRVFDVFITGLEYELDGHTQCCIEPVNFRPSQAFSPVPPARQLPRSTDQERTVALYRGGVELLAASTTFDVSIEEAAEQAGLDPAEARRLVDGDNRFDAQIERFLDHQCREATEVFLSNLRADASPFNRIKALGAGYLGLALSDPAGFLAMSCIGSGSIIPSTFGLDGKAERLGPTLRFLVEQVRDAMQDHPEARNTWALYTYSMALWCAAHGMAHQFSVGSFRHLSLEEKLRSSSHIMDLALIGVAKSIGLEIPATACHRHD
ncbi:hypothetical protein VVR85_02570 [Corynebacterium sp. LK2590]|uniref:hypothetical protein n=1 Tax=unclassified Corynebacterium TaxID=2624378 RepID=UPI0034CE907A